MSVTIIMIVLAGIFLFMWLGYAGNRKKKNDSNK